MSTVTLSSVAIKGLVCAVPGSQLGFDDLARGDMPPAELEQLRQMGLRKLYRTQPGQTTVDLCTAAAKRLLQHLDWSPESVDGVLLATQTPDYFLPSSASVTHAALRLPHSSFALDLSSGCSGFIYGLWLASHLLAGGSARRMLLLVGDTLSQVAAADPPGLLIGDAAAAVALEFEADAPPASFALRSDGTGAPNLILRGGAFRFRGEAQPEPAKGLPPLDELYHHGWELFTFAMSEVPALMETTLRQHKWSQGDVDWFLFHQANRVILQHLGRTVGIPADKMPVNVEHFGNTSGVSIPLLMADAIRGAAMEAAHRVLLISFGVGYAWAGCAMTLGPLRAAEVIPVDPRYRAPMPRVR